MQRKDNQTDYVHCLTAASLGPNEGAGEVPGKRLRYPDGNIGSENLEARPRMQAGMLSSRYCFVVLFYPIIFQESTFLLMLMKRTCGIVLSGLWETNRYKNASLESQRQRP
jgi:hypothetical protein